MRVAACTIIARNYLPAARVLAKSFLRHHPDATFAALVVDDVNRDVDPAVEPFDVLRLDDIGIEHDEALRMAAMYDVMEFCTAVKPWLLDLLLAAGADVAIYLDPDIKVYAPLEEGVAASIESGIVLTPHVTKPLPRDGLNKSETQVLLSGIYNLGFIALSRQAREFLSFWQERLKRECIVEPEQMRFVDQRWVDFVPGIWPAHIVRDPSYNVAYWNLDHRTLTINDSRYFVDGFPLHFFHFSGYSPDTPYLLSKHQDPRPRILFSDYPAVARICEEYGAELLANGYGKDSAAKYAFGRLANGLELDRFMRRLYRDALLMAERNGAGLPPNPLEAANAEGFLFWLTEPPDDTVGGRINRYLKAVHAARVDLRRAFPDPEGINFEAFASWARHEAGEGRLDPRVVELPMPQAGKRLRSRLAFQLSRVERRLAEVPVPGTANQRVRLNMAGLVHRFEKTVTAVPVPGHLERARLNTTRALGRLERRLAAVPIPGTDNDRVRLNMSRWLRGLGRGLTVATLEQGSDSAHTRQNSLQAGVPSPGIRVAGYLRTESGVGEHARLALAAIDKAGIPNSTYLDTTALSRQSLSFEPSGPNRTINLVCINADELPNFARRAGKAFFDGHYTIGLWAWELEEFPKRFAPAFDYVDEVWANSSFSRDAIAAATTKPVYAFPLPVAEPEPDPSLGRDDFGLPDGFLFLFCFDLLSVFERKNPLGLIEAFSKAFAPREGPTLVIKVVNGEFERNSLERLKLAAAKRDDIIVMDRFLDRPANLALMATCDCYASLHRSEGFGLTLAEAMALGKPVIATGYSGNLDFMTPETSYLVPWTPAEVPVGCSPYPAGSSWAEPDLEAAAQIMRQVYEDPAKAANVGRRAKTHVLNNHGLDTGAAFVAGRFRVVQGGLRERGVPEFGTGRLHSGTTPRLVDFVSRPRDLNAPSNHPRAARLYRRVLWRALRSHDDRDYEVHVKLAVSIENAMAETSYLRSLLDRAERQRSEDIAWLRSEAAVRDERPDVLADDLARQARLLDEGARRVDAIATRLGSTELRLGALERPDRWQGFEEAMRYASELHAIPFMSDPAVLMITDADGRPAIGYRAGERLMMGRVSFADIFRGPEVMIRRRLEPYIEFLEGHGPVLDVGCGRGELLDLLASKGVEALGVEIEPSMVEMVAGKGRQVVHGDALQLLASKADGSLGAVFSAQVIEHLSPHQLMTLLSETYRVLRDDGVLVLETVNPYSLQAFRVFWTDITHRHPIYPEPLLFYCAKAGFDEARVIFPNGIGDLSKDRWSEGEYAVVARKVAAVS